MIFTKRFSDHLIQFLFHENIKFQIKKNILSQEFVKELVRQTFSRGESPMDLCWYIQWDQYSSISCVNYRLTRSVHYFFINMSIFVYEVYILPYDTTFEKKYFFYLHVTGLRFLKNSLERRKAELLKIYIYLMIGPLQSEASPPWLNSWKKTNIKTDTSSPKVFFQ